MNISAYAASVHARKTRSTIGLLWTIPTSIVLMFALNPAIAAEEASYEVMLTDDRFEVRAYPAMIVAETIVSGDFEAAGTKSFKSLFNYISGENRTQNKIAMTAPVRQISYADPDDIVPGTSPTADSNRWAVSFVMPSKYEMETLPAPNDPNVTLRQTPPARYASVRYSGFWSRSNYDEHRLKLENWIAQRGLRVIGEAVWARYNAPFTPWFLRRNEILIPVEGV